MKYLLTTAALAASALLQTAQAEDWTHYRGPNHDGISSETIMNTRWGSGPTVVWKTQDYPLGFASFTTSGSQAFTICSRNGQEVTVALNAATGKQNWAYTMTPAKYDGGGSAGTRNNKGGDGPRSTPTISDGRVYSLSAALVLYCMDEKSGKLIWERDIIKENAGVQIRWKNAASPVIEGDLLFVAGGGKNQALLALNKKTGKVVWKTQSDKMTHSTPTVTTIHGQRQVIFFTQTGLVSCDTTSGKVLWRHDFKFAVSTAISPVVAGDIVYCSAGYGVGSAAARVVKSGNRFRAAELWRIHGHKDVANHWSTPVHKGGYLYGMFSFKKYGEGPLKCVELKTGKVIWSKDGFGPGNVTIAGDKIIALADDGHVVIAEASPAKYKELSRAKVIGGKCWSTPILSNGRIYVRSTTEAACLDVAGRTASR